MKKLLCIAMFIASVSAFAQWRSNVEKDLMTGTINTTISALSSVGVNGYGQKAVLFIRVMDNEFEIGIVVGEYLDTKASFVTTRFNETKPAVSVWSISTANTALFSNDPVKLFNELLKANEYVVSVTPYQEAPRIFLFELAGLKVEVNKHPVFREYIND
jgi:hypothetical protein